VRALARAMSKSCPYARWDFLVSHERDNVVMAGPNPFNGQSRVLKWVGLVNILMMLSQGMMNIFCMGVIIAK
jgi:hypothetical protein